MWVIVIIGAFQSSLSVPPTSHQRGKLILQEILVVIHLQGISVMKEDSHPSYETDPNLGGASLDSSMS